VATKYGRCSEIGRQHAPRCDKILRETWTERGAQYVAVCANPGCNDKVTFRPEQINEDYLEMFQVYQMLQSTPRSGVHLIGMVI